MIDARIWYDVWDEHDDTPGTVLYGFLKGVRVRICFLVTWNQVILHSPIERFDMEVYFIIHITRGLLLPLPRLDIIVMLSSERTDGSISCAMNSALP